MRILLALFLLLGIGRVDAAETDSISPVSVESAEA